MKSGNNIKKILIIKPSSLGDVIHALPFLKAIKDTFHDAHIEWVISKSCEGILTENPLIDELIVFDKDSWKNLKNISKTLREIKVLIKTLRAKNVDMVIDLQGLLRSGLITFLARAPLKIGFKNSREGSSIFYNKKVSTEKGLHAVDKCMEIAKAIQNSQKTSASSVEPSKDFGELSQTVSSQQSKAIEFPLYIGIGAKEKVRNLLGGLKEKEYIVIVPSARWQTKRWPPEYFGLLISKIHIPCVITGSKADIKIAQDVMNTSKGKGINLCNKTDLQELITLIKGAKAIVSNDSGPMHIGAALGTPLIALFGPTDPMRTGPYGWSEIHSKQRNKNIKVIQAGLPCSPCFKKRCKEPLCMSKISVEMVLEELREYL